MDAQDPMKRIELLERERQSLVIQNEIVLGLEAAEGTDNLILRC